MKKLGRSAIASLGVAVVLSGCSGDDAPVAPAPHGVDQPDASVDGSAGSGEAGAAGQAGQGGSGGSGGLAGAGGSAGEAGAGGSGGSAGSGGTCGALDQPCCFGNCHQANTTCYADTCVACGGEAQMCCAGACSDGFTCLAGTCSPCGAPGQICCDTSCNDPDFACSGGQCQHCGLENEPCCEGDQCASTTLACSNGVCTQCGGEGQPCCGSACDQFLLCTNGMCECGAEGQYCCGGATCDDPDLTCAGICMCEPVCSPDAKSVLDCHGNVIQACTGTEECVNAACLDPCLEAAATKSSYGCEFWALKTDMISDGRGACFAAFVANTWSTPVHIQVEYDGQTLPVESFARIPQGQGASLTYAPYDATTGLPPGEVAILFLSRGDGPLPACPVPAALGDVGVYGTGRGKAFRIVTDKPVGAYQILPYGGGAVAATSASLLLPTNVWDTSYLAVNAYQKSQAVSSAMPSLNLLAKEDGTQVTVHPRVAILGGTGVASSPAGQPVTYTLNRGEHVQISQAQELTGSMVQSNKPVALWGAASCLNVPTTALACDSAQQQLPPIRTLGNVYVGVRYRDRIPGQTEAPPWRLVGAVDNTNLVWQPSVPSGAPTTLQAGQVVEFVSPGPFVVQSQDPDHPFYVAAYMTGGESFGGRGDPEWVNVVPADQFLDKYVLFTDPTYAETNLVVVRRPDVNGQWADVHLGCLGNLTGWTQVGDFQYTRVDLVTGNFQNVGNCSNGRHEMSSAGPFGVTVWGWGSDATTPWTAYVSYAYPAGASVRQINDVK